VFKNNATTIDPEQASKVKERLRSTLRAGEPFVTGKDWDLDVLKLSADDAGFVAASKLTATQVANIFGVPPELVGGETGTSLTYSTTEQQQIQFITNTLRPWLVRLEAAFSSLLPRPQYVKFNVDSLIRVDTKTRYEVHRIAREIGLNNVDELRALEDREPLPGGQGADYAPLKAAPAPQEAQ
jgi:HK97 family phage portal protein